MQPFPLSEVSPVLKSALVGVFATVGAAIEQDWKIVWASVALQLGMAAITAFVAHRGKPSRSRNPRKQKNAPPTKGQNKSPDNGANVK